MPDLTTLRSMLSKSALTAADLAWLERLGFSDSAVPPVETPSDAADYERRAAVLLASIQSLSLWERESHPASKLAAAIGAQLANWRDGQTGDEDE